MRAYLFSASAILADAAIFLSAVLLLVWGWL